MESLLNECEKNYDCNDEYISYADKIIKDVEGEFKGYESIKTIRKDEKNKCISALEKCQREMMRLAVKSKIKVNNYQKRTRILKNISDKKKKIQNKINMLTIKLEDLDIESGDFDTPESDVLSNSTMPYNDILF
jgi:hypothetical protein